MKFIVYIIPILILFLLIYSFVKKKSVYELFILGTKETLPLIFSLFPYLTAILVMNELMKVSGLLDFIACIFSPVFSSVYPSSVVCCPLPSCVFEAVSCSASAQAVKKRSKQRNKAVSLIFIPLSLCIKVQSLGFPVWTP